MTTKELVNTIITGIIFSIIIVFCFFGIVSCSMREEESSYTTTITVASERDFGVWDSDRKTMANIEINSEYSFKDYQIDYDNDRIIINLKKEEENKNEIN